MKPTAVLSLLAVCFGLAEVRAAEPGNAASLVRDYRGGLVFVEGKAGQGSGFIAEVKGRKFLFSNAHVLAGIRGPAFKLLDRTPVQVGASSVAVGHDLVALSVIAGGKPLPAMDALDQTVSIGDPVVVLGNAEGAGVVNLLQGKVVGIGPNLVEVDAPFVPGNSGSPIIHVRTGKVIGVATYLLVKKVGPQREEIRRFGFRLDSVQKWQPIEWNRFYAEADAMEKIEKLTGDLVSVLNDLSRHGRPTRTSEAPVIRSALDNFNKTVSQRQNSRDTDRAVTSLLSALRFASQGDVRDARARFTYDFFQQQLGKEEREREELAKVFDQALKSQSK